MEAESTWRLSGGAAVICRGAVRAGAATLVLAVLVLLIGPPGSRWGLVGVAIWAVGALVTGVVQLLVGLVERRRCIEAGPPASFPLALLVSSMVPAGAVWGTALCWHFPTYATPAAAVATLVAGVMGVAIGLLAGFYAPARRAYLASFWIAALVSAGGGWGSGGAGVGLLGAYLAALTLASIVVGVVVAQLQRGHGDALDLGCQISDLQLQLDKARQKLLQQTGHRQSVEKELSTAKEQADTANLAKSEFLATMSHEIRTPLNGVVPLLEMLRDSELNGEQRQYVNTALGSSYHLLRIIDDILDYSKIEAGKMELERIELNLQEIVESVTLLLTKSAERRSLKLGYVIKPGVPRRVRGDPIRIRQILTNLVGNAIKFTERGGVLVEVSKRRSSRKEVEIQFAVKDSGVGMSKQTAEKLFSFFTQADASTTRRHGGTGLGLAICKRLAEMMGGTIGVQSKIGKGSVFWFTVPMRRSITDVPSQRKNLKGARVVIVGVDAYEYRELSRFFDEWEIVYDRADSPMDALDKLRSSARLGDSWAYELLLVDAGGLGGAALTLLQQVKTSDTLMDLQTLVIEGEMSLRSKMEEFGISDLLRPPINKGELRGKLHRLLDVQVDSKSGLGADAPLAMPVMLDEEAWIQESTLVETVDQPPPVRSAQLQYQGRVLLAEDNAVNLSVAKKMLERLGLSCDVAVDGLQALAAIEQEPFDLVFMDCQMPRMDGYEATRSIRIRESMHKLPRLPVVAMTANAMAGDRQKCLDAGMDDYLSKPINAPKVQGILNQWLPSQQRPEPRAAEPAAMPTAEPRGRAIDESSPIDRQIIEELREVMEEEFDGLLQTYLETAPNFLDQLEQGAGSGDVERMVLPAHSLKSSSANVGALRLSEFAKEVEHASRQGQTERAVSASRKVRPEARAGAVGAQAHLRRGDCLARPHSGLRALRGCP